MEAPKEQSTGSKRHEEKRKVMVLGVGNLILTDEGFGIHVVQELQERREELGIDPDVQIMDGGTLGLDLLHYIEGLDKLIIVDVVNGGTEPGTIFKFTPKDIETETVRKLSLHQVTLMDVLGMAKDMDQEPKETVIVAVEPKDISNWGMELSDELKVKIPKVIEIVLKELKDE
jgi:hydrogenase maturation protease